jgi:hypothetical protein
MSRVSRKNVRRMGRREFVRNVSLGAAALALPTRLKADPYAPTSADEYTGTPVRIHGRVRSGRRTLGGAGVSDGRRVVESANDGTFELVTTSDQPFVHVCVPSGYEIPRNPTGTARFYRPIRPNSEGEVDAEFDLVPLDRPDEDHAVLLLADPQTEDAVEMGWLHEQTVPDVRQVAAGLGGVETFAIACGDIMYDNLGLFPDYERAVEATGLPFFQVVGNHDLDSDSHTDLASARTFSRHFGPRYYSFERGQVHYVVLDDVFWHGTGYIGYLEARQLEWLKADLARVEPGRTVIVSLHIPVLGSRYIRNGESRPGLGLAITNREALYRLLEPYDAHVLSAHTHESEHVFEGGVHEHVCGATCGAWWSGPICGDGTPKGYAVYEIRGSEVTWRYRSTGHGFDHQIRAYPHGAAPDAPDEIVANVWDWDPEWTVVWYEDGERKGPMARRVGLDPLAAELHTGPDLPPRRTWVEPYRTGHLFYAPASRVAREVRVEARDRFGRVYSATIAAE